MSEENEVTPEKLRQYFEELMERASGLRPVHFMTDEQLEEVARSRLPEEGVTVMHNDCIVCFFPCQHRYCDKHLAELERKAAALDRVLSACDARVSEMLADTNAGSDAWCAEIDAIEAVLKRVKREDHEQ